MKFTNCNTITQKNSIIVSLSISRLNFVESVLLAEIATAIDKEITILIVANIQPSVLIILKAKGVMLKKSAIIVGILKQAIDKTNKDDRITLTVFSFLNTCSSPLCNCNLCNEVKLV